MEDNYRWTSHTRASVRVYVRNNNSVEQIMRIASLGFVLLLKFRSSKYTIEDHVTTRVDRCANKVSIDTEPKERHAVITLPYN